MKIIALSLRAMSVCLVALSLIEPVLGQQEGHYSRIVDAHQGYWKLKTDYTIHGTWIYFFDSDSQLVYQESLPNQFIKLTPKNIRRLDQTLSRLVTNQLVASSISTSDLPYEVPKRLPRRRDPASASQASDQPSKQAPLTFQPQLYTPVGTASVHLLLANPTLERLTIQILSADNTSVYEHVTHLGDSRHHLNLSGMPAGAYQIRIKSATQQYQQPITLTYGLNEAIVQIRGDNELPTSKLVTSHK